ncbi:MAG TPA: acetoacetate decarboxylase family protein, partial [Steroidobacteraceae bacterium]|nr:acetoacetate decarboxylase family protein [Steroidobacteraceae bacterium]
IHYGAGSTLQYHELIVAPALVRLGWRMGAWISHIYVDSEMSMLAGREIWGLPKQLAAFHWSGAGAEPHMNNLRVAVKVKRSTLAACLPLFGPIFGSDAHVLKWSIASGSAALRRVPGRLDVSGGDFDALGFDRVHAFYRLESFRLTMKAPRLEVARAQARK